MSTPRPEVRLGFRMAVDNLRDTCQRLDSARAEVDRLMAERDQEIRAAKDLGVPYPRLSAITGLSRDRLYTVVNSPLSDV